MKIHCYSWHIFVKHYTIVISTFDFWNTIIYFQKTNLLMSIALFSGKLYCDLGNQSLRAYSRDISCYNWLILVIETVDVDSVYAVTGAPHPRDLDQIFETVMSATDFESALETVRRVQRTMGLAVVDIVRGLYARLASLDGIPDAMRISVNQTLADLEYRLAGGATEGHQLAALVGVFYISRRHLLVSS
jgi:hypothetical protein